ncbi:tryptophan--tRNA ligase [bacterium]|nr:tryptophan--tRNA ligase [bacterium]
MRVFSGVRPTGKLHIGNYLGAIRQWLELQEKEDCIFCIVDLHAITTPFHPKELQKNIFETAISYLSSGLNPEKCVFFVQSRVKEHTELSWILGTICPIGELKRMTQFKEKTKKHKKYVNAGLLNYPLLMAADILLYQADIVPVGSDQVQHVELTRELARRFNQKFGNTFRVPKILLPKIGAKIMSLQNPRKKMSKTDTEKGYIGIFDTPKEIEKKVMAAVTDPGKKIVYNPQRKPGISNLLVIYSLFSGKEIKELEKEFRGKGYAVFKKSLISLLITTLEPLRKKRKELLQREVYVREILNKGAKKAQKIATSTMEKVKQNMGLS